jgi:hypothetical protein
VAFDVATGLLLYLIDALDDVADVAAPDERSALGALTVPLRTPQQLADRVRDVLAQGDPSSVPGALAIERVLALLCVAAAPALLPGATADQISALIDTAAGVSAAEATAADAETARLLVVLDADGIVETGIGGMAGELRARARPQAPSGLRAALADAVVQVADELGLLDDADNPHAPGTVLEVEVSLDGAEPARWRRLHLAADADLGELHLAVQLAFDWDDTATHEFVRAGDPDEVFSAVDRLGDEIAGGRSAGGGSTGGASAGVGSTGGDGGGSDDIDETEVEVGELLAEPGDEVEYRYGGDPGTVAVDRISIRLLRVVESVEETLPRCTAASAGDEVAEIDRLLAPLRLR